MCHGMFRFAKPNIPQFTSSRSFPFSSSSSRTKEKKVPYCLRFLMHGMILYSVPRQICEIENLLPFFDATWFSSQRFFLSRALCSAPHSLLHATP
jgi:hypothetical protein